MASDSEATYASDNTTLVAIIDGFEVDGYTGQAVVADEESVRCTMCQEVSPAWEWYVDALRRVEGASDPADMAAVVAIRCPDCDAKATIVLKFGPEATPEESGVLGALDDRPRLTQQRPSGGVSAEGALQEQKVEEPS